MLVIVGAVLLADTRDGAGGGEGFDFMDGYEDAAHERIGWPLLVVGGVGLVLGGYLFIHSDRTPGPGGPVLPTAAPLPGARLLKDERVGSNDELDG